jgi:Caspase domain
MVNSSVKRRGIIIASPGRGRDCLPGVKEDVRNMCWFLMSPRGGAWRSDEIAVLWMPSRGRVFEEISKARGGLLRVYFSGHGTSPELLVENGSLTEIFGRTWLALNDDELMEDIELIDEGVFWTQVVCDCCRIRPGAALSGIPETGGGLAFDEEEYIRARIAFDNWVQASAKGFVIVHGTSDGTIGGDSRDGGLFTLALLRGAIFYRLAGQYSPISIQDLVAHARTVLQMNGNWQAPEVAYQSGEFTVPFALDTPGPFLADEGGLPETASTRGACRGAESQSKVNGWLAFGGILLGAWLLSEIGQD